MSVTDNVTELLEPIVATLGVELVDVEFNGGTLRVTVDQDGGITTDVLANVNRNIGPILDQHDPIPGRYTLEVSSPGVERRLNTLAHYRRAVGENVIVKLFPGQEQRRLRGELLSVNDADGGAGSVVVDAVEIDGVDLDDTVRHEISLADVSKARTVFDWGPSPKPGKKGSKKKKGAGNKQAPESKQDT